MTKTIKGIDKETWSEFKSIAAEHKMKLSMCFKQMVKTYKQRSSDVWNDILSTPRLLTDEEAEEMLKFVEKTRKEKGFRE